MLADYLDFDVKNRYETGKKKLLIQNSLTLFHF